MGFDWSAHYDDEGRLFYYNDKTEESSWEPPPEGFNPPPSKWAAHLDEENNTYYYNQETGETQWEKPDDFVESATSEANGEANEAMEQEEAGPIETSTEKAEPETATETKPSSPQLEVDPEVLKLQQAQEALKQPDSILEPNISESVIQVVQAQGNDAKQAIETVVAALTNQTAICGLLAKWLVDMDTDHELIRQTAEDIINSFAKERFTREAGDRITELRKSQTQFLVEMMESPRWRKLLIDLSSNHKDSAILKFCLGEISKRGHHREIASRINQSEHFEVFNAMLSSEIKSVARLAIAAGREMASNSLDEVTRNLEMACSASEYTYVYSLEVIRTILEEVKKDYKDARIKKIICKLQKLMNRLQTVMMDPESSQGAEGDTIFRRRKLEVALAATELHQRKRRRIVEANGNSDGASQLEGSLLGFVKRFASGTRIDANVLDPLLPRGLSTDDNGIGKLLLDTPLAIKALLNQLFRSGSSRASEQSVRSKCARLLSFATLAAESINEAHKSQYEEKMLTALILEGSELCKDVEARASFLVTSTENTNVGASPGEKLCSLCMRYPIIAQGAMIWAKDLVCGHDFVNLATFVTISNSVLSMVRVVSLHQPFTRTFALEIASVFLRLANSEINYKKMSAIKEQALRLMLFLITKGDVVEVLSAVKDRVEDKSSSTLDASLIRYFVNSLLQITKPPISLPFACALSKLLQSQDCLAAVLSTYFESSNRKTLAELLESATLNSRGEDMKLLTSTLNLIKNSI